MIDCLIIDVILLLINKRKNIAINTFHAAAIHGFESMDFIMNVGDTNNLKTIGV